MRHGVVALLAVAAVVCGGARAEPGLFVGLADDTLKSTPGPTGSVARDLGLRAYSISVPWLRGEWQLSPATAGAVETAVANAAGARVVLWISGVTNDAPNTADAREQYCSFALDALRRFPQVRDVVIWNEPNLGVFWATQFAPDGTSSAPREYGLLLARCWDLLHAFRPNVNVIGPATSPWGNDVPNGFGNISHSPTRFLLELGAAYRATGRGKPLFDTLGHHPYPASSGERPWRTHSDDRLISIGDLDRLVGATRQAFGGTAQPVPGDGLKIWYLETGYQTVPDPAKRSLYRGEENWPGSLPDNVGGEPAQPPPSADSVAPDQATQLVDSVRLAYCQPYVQAYFNFQLRDEIDLAGWQSGVLWADGSRKGSYEPFKRVVAEVNDRAVDCARLKGSVWTEETPGGAKGTQQPGAGNAPDRLAGADGRTPSRIVWTTRNPVPFGFARLSARVSSGGRRLAGRSVSFEVGKQVYVATTDRSGTASTPPAPPLRPGPHVVTASFRGDRGHRPASVKVLLRVRNTRALVSSRTPARATASVRPGLTVGFDGRRVTGVLRVRAGGRSITSRRLTALGVSPDRRTAWFGGLTVGGVSVLGKVELGRAGRDVLRLWVNGRQLRAVRGLDLRIAAR